MVDWRAAMGSSVINIGLGVVLFGIALPLKMTCYDCGPSTSIDPYWPPTEFSRSPPRLNVYAIAASIPPVVTTDASFRLTLDRACPGQMAVDRLPVLRIPEPRVIAVSHTTKACLHIDAAGRIDAIRVIGGRRGKVQRLSAGLPFAPAYRDGKPVGAWVGMEIVR